MAFNKHVCSECGRLDESQVLPKIEMTEVGDEAVHVELSPSNETYSLNKAYLTVGDTDYDEGEGESQFTIELTVGQAINLVNSLADFVDRDDSYTCNISTVRHYEGLN